MHHEYYYKTDILFNSSKPETHRTHLGLVQISAGDFLLLNFYLSRYREQTTVSKSSVKVSCAQLTLG